MYKKLKISSEILENANELNIIDLSLNKKIMYVKNIYTYIIRCT